MIDHQAIYRLILLLDKTGAYRYAKQCYPLKNVEKY